MTLIHVFHLIMPNQLESHVVQPLTIEIFRSIKLLEADNACLTHLYFLQYSWGSEVEIKNKLVFIAYGSIWLQHMSREQTICQDIIAHNMHYSAWICISQGYWIAVCS